MHKIAKKVYISLLTVALVCITMFATTYAWVGMLTNSTFDDFNIDLSVTKLSAYDVELSLTGEPGTFGSSIDKKQLKKILLNNMGYNNIYDNNVESVFKTILLNQASVKRLDNPNYIPGGNEPRYLTDFEVFTDSNGKKGCFIDADGNVVDKVFKFDLYVSVAKSINVDGSNSDDIQNSTDYALDIYLEGNLFSSKINKKSMINNFVYPSDFVNDIPNGIPGGTKIDKEVTVKPEYACRISIQKYQTVDKYHPEQYQNNNKVKSLLIYEGGSHMPTYTEEKGYSFGGILEDPINLALSDWNKMYPEQKRTVPEWALERGDIEYNYNDLNQIIDKNDKVSINSMVKLTICFWFEGWDADCFSVIDKNPVDLNFKFTTKEKYE